MKIFYNIIISILLILPVLSAQDSLVVISYNIQGQRPGTNPEIRLLHIIEHLKKLDPDIIGIQEINEDIKGSGEDNQGKIIADSLSAYFDTPYYFYQSMTHLSWDAQFREYVGIITKYPVEHEDFKSLPKGTFNRKVVWNYIDTPLGKVNFFNTHLSFNAEDARVRQVEEMLPYIEEQTSIYPGVATLITGDFNATPSSTPIRFFTHTGTDTFFFDSYREINPFSMGYTVPANNPDSRIDYIFNLSTSSLDIDKSMVIMDTTYNGADHISDHLGVLGVFKEADDPGSLRFNPYLDFNEALIWMTKDTIITITNSGTQRSDIYTISSNNSAFFVNKTVFSIPAGESDQLTVSFYPSAGMDYEGILIIENSAGRNRPMFLSGSGITLTFDSDLNFGPVLVDAAEDTLIPITNPTYQEITVSGIYSDNPDYSARPNSFIVPAQGIFPLILTFLPQNPGLSDGVLTLLTDAGEPSFSLSGIGLESSSWTMQNSGTPHDILDISFADSLTGWVVGNNGTILKTEDAGINWVSQTSGIISNLRSVYFVTTDLGWVVGDNGTILKTIDGGELWTPDTSGTISILLSVFFINQSVGWASGTSGVILKTEDGGKHWVSKASGGFSAFTSIYFSNSETGWVVGTFNLIWKTLDGGESWEIQSSASDEDLWSVRFHDTLNGWIAGENGSLFKTDNGGNSWIEQPVPLRSDFFDLHLGPADVYWIVGDQGTLLKSSDAGLTWIPQYSGTAAKLNAISFGSSQNGIITAAGGMILNTTNGGIVGLEDQKRSGNQLPATYVLSRNYPNPFNPKTIINYQLPTTNNVELNIYNILGQRVATLVDKNQPAGYYQIEWDARQISSGVYYYELRAGDFRDVKKMILLR